MDELARGLASTSSQAKAPGKANSSEPEPRGTNTLGRGIKALMLIAASPKGRTIVELAAELDVHRSVSSRLIGQLTNWRLVTRLGSGRYVTGPGVMSLVSHYEDHFRAVAQPVLDDLAQTSGLNCALVVQAKKLAVVIAEAGPRNTSMLLSYRTGADIPLDRGSVGYALAACRGPIEGEPEQVVAARTNGVVFSYGEVIPGSYGVSAPVRRPDGNPSCIHVFSLTEEPAIDGVTLVRDAAERLNSILSLG